LQPLNKKHNNKSTGIMYAIVEIDGHQHKVTKAQKIYVNRLSADEGTNVEFDKVLLVDNEGDVIVGLPFVDGTRVAAKVMAHLKDDKVFIFKHKRRKGYRRFNGHRQYMTELFIHGILGKGETLKEDLAPVRAPKKVAPAKAEANVAETEAPKKKAAAPKKKAAAPKKEAAEPKATKKPAAKKAAPKKKSKE
jgi:large subunit ribosomal protein L21